jgi:hypothetical protein
VVKSLFLRERVGDHPESCQIGAWPLNTNFGRIEHHDGIGAILITNGIGKRDITLNQTISLVPDFFYPLMLGDTLQTGYSIITYLGESE